jgi:translation initiation factor IF-3
LRRASAATVRLIGEEKEMLGVCTRAEALQQAEDAGLDLVRRKRDRALRIHARADAHCAAADAAH